MRQILVGMIIVNTLLLMSSQVQAEIYKCKNNDGLINFTSVPCGETSSGIKRPVTKEIEHNKDGTVKTNKQIIEERLKKEKEFLEANKRQRDEEKQRREKLEAHNKKIENNCKKAKQDLKLYQRSQYLYSKNSDGEKVILNEEQRKKAEKDSQRRITYWCR